MPKFPSKIELYLLKITDKLSSSKHLNALKDGFAYALPFIIIGTLILMITNLPFSDPNSGFYWEWYTNIMANHKDKLSQPYYVSMSILSIYISFSIGYSLSQQYKLSPVTGGLIALFSFLMVATSHSELITSGVINITPNIENGAYVPIINAKFLDAKGLFTAILTAFFAIHIYRFLLNKKLVLTLPDSIAPALARSFEVIVPIFIITVLLQFVNIFFASLNVNNLPNAIMVWIGSPLSLLSNNLISVIVIVFVIHLLWVFGLHGGNIVLAVISPILLVNFQANIDSLQLGEDPVKIFTYGYFDYFVYAGGAGATLGLSFLFLFSRHSHFQKLGKITIVPSIFNINEPVIFGAPVVGNPILAIPFIFIPIINTIISWIFLKYGLINKITALVPWTMPSPFAALIGTQSFLALALSIFLIILSIALYLPFFRIYEKTFDKK